MTIDVLRHAVRIFRREPAFAATATVLLALGLGANIALFASVDAALLRPLPFAQGDDLLALRHRDVRTGLTKPDVAIGDFVDLRGRQRVLESLAGYGGFQGTLYGEGEPIRVQGAAVTPDALAALRLRPAVGRLLRSEDARDGAPSVVMVSDELWRTRLGSDPRALERSVQIGDARRLIVGILPPGFRFPGMAATDVIVAQPVPAVAPAQRKSGWVYAIGRLRAGRTLADAEAELAALSAQFETEHPGQNRGSRYEARTLRDSLVGDTRQALLLLLAAVAFVQLMACANVGNLLLARALDRQHEQALRLALGASRRKLVAQVMAEAAALAVAGVAGGVLLAGLFTPLLVALLPDASRVPGLAQAGVGSGALLFGLGVALVSALLFGGIACVSLSRSGRSGPVRERQGTMSRRATMAASALVAGEIALAMVLVAAGGLTLRSFGRLLAVDPGFTPSGVLTLQLSLPDGRYEADEARRLFFERAFRDLEALPGIASVGAAQVVPLTGNNWTAPLQRVDRPVPAGERPPEVGWQLASAGYVRALRIPLRAGRLFGAADATGPPVVMVSEAVADRFFAGERALGQRISLGTTQAEIVGVVGNIRRAALFDDPRADLYFPFERVNSPSTTLFVRATGDPLAVLPAVRTAIRRIEPLAVVDEMRTLAQVAEASAAVTRLATRLLGGFAALSLGLAATGVYAVMAYQVRRRRRELGTRLALGASPVAIARLVFGRALVVAAVGLAIGLAAAVAFAHTLTSVLFDVPPWDPATLAASGAVLTAVVLAASYLPARRAARTDPASVLAAE